MSVKVKNRIITIGIEEFRTVMESVIVASRVIPVPTFVCSTMNVSDWIDDFEAKTKQADWNDDRRLQKVRNFLEVDVELWYNVTFENPVTRPKDWQEFKQRMIRVYAPVGHLSNNARFYKTRQGENENVITYCSKMFYYAKQANKDFQTFVSTCIEGFRREILREFSRNRISEIETFDDLMERARIAEEDSLINIDNPPIRPRDVGCRDVPYRYVTDAYANSTVEPFVNSKINPAYDQQKYNGASQSNNTSTFATVVNDNHPSHTNIACNYCQKVGHITKQCRKKQRDQQKLQACLQKNVGKSITLAPQSNQFPAVN